MNAEQMPDAFTAQALRYQDVAGRIERQILDGVLRPGCRILGERDLSRVMGVGRVTVRRALAELKARGLVESDQARGWFVSAAAVTERNVLRSFTELALLRGTSPEARVIRRSVREADVDEAALFGIGPRDPVFEISRLRLMDGAPIAIETSRVPLTLCPQLSEADFSVASLHTLLREAGAEPVQADYALTATVADDPQARLLAVEPGAALLLADSVARDLLGRVVECSHSLFRADRYRFHTTLRRRPHAD